MSYFSPSIWSFNPLHIGALSRMKEFSCGSKAKRGFQSPSQPFTSGHFLECGTYRKRTRVWHRFNPLHIGALSRIKGPDHDQQPGQLRFNPLHIGALSRITLTIAENRLQLLFQSPSHRGTFSNHEIPRSLRALLTEFQSPSHRGTFSNRLTILRAL